MRERLFKLFAFSFLGAVLMVSGVAFLKAEEGEKKGLIQKHVSVLPQFHVRYRR